MLPLFDEPTPAEHNESTRPSARHGTPLNDAWTLGFHQGASELTPTRMGPEWWSDPREWDYYREGYRVGRLFRPLPCVKEKR